MKRREFITLLGGAAAAWPLVARAQERRRIPKVGVLWHAASAEEEGALFSALVEGFRTLGYIDGQNIILEHRFPNELPERFRSMAAELVSLNVDVLVSSGNNAASYAKNATATIPLVAIFISDPVGTKLVDSLARPGGNVTGLSFFTSELIGKRLQFLKETIPNLSRVAQLVNPLAQISRLYTDLTQTAAVQLGLTVERFEARSRGELGSAFEAMNGGYAGCGYQCRWTSLCATRTYRTIGAQDTSTGRRFHERDFGSGDPFVVWSRQSSDLSPGGCLR
jgi:putative ABC transport system substrate-binding protein